MSVNNVGSPQGGAAFGQGSSLPKSAQTATLLTPASIRELVNAGWVSGKVSSDLGNGSFRISTNLGDVTISAPKATFSVGSSIMLSYDRPSGRVIYTPSLPTEVTEGTKPSKGPQGSSPGVSTPQSPTPSSVPVSLALGDVPPLQRAVSAGSQHSVNQALSVVFPTTSNSSFALIASLFPMVVRGGVLSKLATEQDKRYASSSRMHKLAEDALVPIKRIDDSAGFMSWSMPFFSEGQVHMSKWFQGDEAVSGEDEQKAKRTFLEVWMEFCGVVQVDAVIDSRELSIHIVTEKTISEELKKDLGDIVMMLGKAFSLDTSFHHISGAEFLENHFE